MGNSWSNVPDEHYKIMLDRSEHTMILLCNEIEVDPQATRVDELVDKFNRYSENLRDEHRHHFRDILVNKLATQIKNELGKPVMNNDRIEYLERWVDRLTLIPK